METDRIEKKLVLRAPRSRVWRAIADSKEFGSWFGVSLEGPFSQGARLRGRITLPKYEHMTLDLEVQSVEPEHLLSFRWHPYAIDPSVDYSSEPMTLVEFHLAEQGRDTLLTVIESGFDRIPLARRSEAFRMNSNGWAAQILNIERHVAP